ncbi:MAG TPA: TonB-dependent receptor, partial [Longimicrobiaceae bacterium]|nr:TonB-dependent receptor [Longimicrobiaceae bacterium]
APAGQIGRATVRVLDAAPGLNEVGLADAARAAAGDEPLDPGSILYVRGAASDLKLVHLDGAPVYAPFPLGGLLDPFAPEMLANAEIYLGGAPARFDGGLSYVMDLRTRRARTSGARTTGSLDLLSGTAIAEAGFGGRFGVIASVRGMHPLSSSGLLAGPLPYDYGEGLIRADASLGQTGTLSVTGFTNHEAVWMTHRAPESRTIEWGNRAGSARLGGRVGETEAELTAAIGRYEARLPLGGDRNPIAEGTALRSRVALDLVRPAAHFVVRYGASLDDQSYDAQAGSPVDGDPTRSIRAAGTVVGVYGEVSVQPVPKLSLRGGGRVDHFSTTGEVTLAPRVAATWMVTDHAAVTIAAGRYHQFLRPPDELLLNSYGSADLQLQGPLIVGSASHFTAALEQDLGDGVALGLEGFYKRFSDLPSVSTSASNASGVDLWVRRSGETISGWFGYSLAWVWASGTQPGQGDFSGRHLLSTGLSVPIGDRTDVEFRFAYGAGLPYAGIPLRNFAGEMAATPEFNRTATLQLAERGGTESAPLLFTPDDPFVRFDAALSRSWTSTRAGRRIDFVPFLRVINGLGARDALFYFLDKSAGIEEPTPLGALPIIPILGVEWRF